MSDEDVQADESRDLPDDLQADDDAFDFVGELKRAAWNIVKENPGLDRSDWIDMLIRHYPTEVVDAYGTNPSEVFHALADLWDMEYTDPDTGEWNSYAGWSEYLATDPDVLRDRLDRANEHIKKLETEVRLLKARLQHK